MIRPLPSSTLSSGSATVKLAVSAPAVTTASVGGEAGRKLSPARSVTATLTVRSAVGAGAAVTVKVAVSPSATGPPATMDISGSADVARPGDATCSTPKAPLLSGERP